jgi:hypothetical protein
MLPAVMARLADQVLPGGQAEKWLRGQPGELVDWSQKNGIQKLFDTKRGARWKENEFI